MPRVRVQACCTLSNATGWGPPDGATFGGPPGVVRFCFGLRSSERPLCSGTATTIAASLSTKALPAPASPARQSLPVQRGLLAPSSGRPARAGVLRPCAALARVGRLPRAPPLPSAPQGGAPAVKGRGKSPARAQPSAIRAAQPSASRPSPCRAQPILPRPRPPEGERARPRPSHPDPRVCATHRATPGWGPAHGQGPGVREPSLATASPPHPSSLSVACKTTLQREKTACGRAAGPVAEKPRSRRLGSALRPSKLQVLGASRSDLRSKVSAPQSDLRPLGPRRRPVPPRTLCWPPASCGGRGPSGMRAARWAQGLADGRVRASLETVFSPNLVLLLSPPPLDCGACGALGRALGLCCHPAPPKATGPPGPRSLLSRGTVKMPRRKSAALNGTSRDDKGGVFRMHASPRPMTSKVHFRDRK
ncbi:skin secretory protein xP2-like [Fukomys damarensis]|uniref:skin secretory protein xP2-like n=1 Tax=Fukomys damarensis TaxID=885580 RepID=UPI00145585F3|nr:skin secretory protein xP2-like [Fukomys damarensis]